MTRRNRLRKYSVRSQDPTAHAALNNLRNELREVEVDRLHRIAQAAQRANLRDQLRSVEDRPWL